MKKPQIGDEVSLRKGLIEGEKYGEMTLYPYMSFKGYQKIKRMSIDDNTYILSESSFVYPKEMLIFHKTKKL